MKEKKIVWRKRKGDGKEYRKVEHEKVKKIEMRKRKVRRKQERRIENGIQVYREEEEKMKKIVRREMAEKEIGWKKRKGEGKEDC